MSKTMVALLEPAEPAVEDSTQGSARSSAIEREILDLLRRPARSPPSITDLRRELLASFTEVEIQRAIIDLLNRGAVELVRMSKGIGFKLPTGGPTAEFRPSFTSENRRCICRWL